MLRTFAKYQALGNDFIVLDAASFAEASLSPQYAQRLCDRHLGVGADGVLWIERLSHLSARLVIINADGSRPEMCGNGVRCVAAYLADEHGLLPGQCVQLATDAGPRPVTLLRQESAGVWISSVDMGSIVVEREAFASIDGATLGEQGPEAFYADAGNPHAVVIGEVALENQESVAQMLRSHFANKYPHGTNVEFVSVEQDLVRVRVHERGVGWTLACGTGACAVAAVLAAREESDNRECTVRLDGGTLWITVRKVEDTPTQQYAAVMVGPAERSFAGTLNERGSQ